MAQKKLYEKPFVRYLKNALLIDSSILVIGDLHLGYEDEIVRAAVLPNVQLREVFSDLEGIFDRLNKEKVRLREIVLLGDLKHEFGVISDSEWRDVGRLVDYLKKKCEKLVILKGNHDLKLGPILRKHEVELKDWYKTGLDSTTPLNISNIKNKQEAKSDRVLGLRDTKKKSGGRGRNIYFLHGDKMKNKLFKQVFGQGLDSKKRVGIRQTLRQTDRQTAEKDVLVLGHLHPSISLANNYKKERYKCFLKGNWKGFLVYILPSFSSVGFGYDVRNLGGGICKEISKKMIRRGSRSRLRSRGVFDFIIPDKDLKKFEVVVYDSENGKGLRFGKLGRLIKEN